MEGKPKEVTYGQSVIGATIMGTIFYPMAIGPAAADAFDGTFDNHRLQNTYDPENDPGRIEYLKHEDNIEGEYESFFSHDTIHVSSGDVGELVRAAGLELFLAVAAFKLIQGTINKARQQATQGQRG